MLKTTTPTRLTAAILFQCLACNNQRAPDYPQRSAQTPAAVSAVSAASPADSRALFALADRQWRSGQLEEAAINASKAADASRVPLVKAAAHMLLAAIEHSQARCEKALPHSELARDLYIQHLGPNSEDAAAASHNLATCHAALGNLELALQSEQDVLRIASFNPALSPTLMADVSRGLGTIHYSRGEYEQASEYFREALESHRGIHGADSIWVAIDLQNLANVAVRQKKYELALRQYEDVGRVFRRHWSDSDPSLIQFYAITGKIRAHLGQRTEAVAALRRAQALLPPGERTTRAALVAHCAGEAYLVFTERERAVAFLREALSLRTQLLGSSNMETIETQQVLRKALALPADATEQQ